jgi:excisionase family DNA binding protein
MPEIQDVLTAQQAAALLNAHVETIRRMARKGNIPAFKIGKDWRFRKSALLGWAETNPEIKKIINVLMIDDDAAVCRLMHRIIEPLGYRVLSTTRGTEGLDIARNESINLVLLDLEMSEMSGPEFLRELRKDRKDIPVIIVTGYPDSNLMMKASHFGPLTLIPKPINKKLLLSAVTMTLGGTMVVPENA